MKLSPLDIRKHEFSRKLRGYDPEEVRAFMETVSQQWEEVLNDLRRSEDRVREIENKISHYEKVEMALQEALESARAGAKRSQDNAEERASLIVEEAELKAEQVMQDAEQQRFQLQQDVVALQNRHNEVTARLRHFLMSELEILARHEDDQPIGFMKLVPAAPAEALPQPQSASPAPEAPPERTASRPTPSKPPAEPTAPADSPEPEASESKEGSTTYADIYERAAEAEAARPAPLAPQPEPDEPLDDGETTWTLRSIVTGLDDDDEPQDEATDTEQDRIRRILEDLD